jgi:hypothetical protein
MLVFIVPLRSPETCSNWSNISDLCNSTLKSLLRQTSPNFKIILCCNELPLNFENHEKIVVIQEDFPIPKTWDEANNDVFAKLKRAMIEAKQFGSSFIMRVDADDLVSKHLVEYTDRYQDCDGWYIWWGYMHPVKADYVYLRPRFNTVCGTSHIFKCEANEFPLSMDTPSQDWLEPVRQHLNVNNLLIPYNKKLKPFPFPGVSFSIYTNNTSGLSLDSDRFKKIKNVILQKIFRRKISQKLIDEFALQS